MHCQRPPRCHRPLALLCDITRAHTGLRAQQRHCHQLVGTRGRLEAQLVGTWGPEAQLVDTQGRPEAQLVGTRGQPAAQLVGTGGPAPVAQLEGT